MAGQVPVSTDDDAVDVVRSPPGGAPHRGADRSAASTIARAVRLRRLQIASLVSSLLAHGACFLLSFPGDPVSRQGFLLLVITSAGLEIAGHAVHRVSHFRILHAARVACLASLFLLLDPRAIAGPLILTIPYLVETALFDAQAIATAWDSAAIVLLATALFVPRTGWAVHEKLAHVAAFVLATGMTASLALVAIYHREENARRAAEIRELSSTVRNLVEANMALQLYAHNIETESTEKERGHITRELHDMVGYALTNVIIMMNAAHVLLRDEPGSLDKLFDDVRVQAEAALADTRSTLRRLRDVRPFEPIGLRALWHLTRGFQGATGIEVRLNLGNLPSSFGRKLDSVLFRITQEGLTNAFRHGKATGVRINLWQTKGEILISILDNGRGIAPGTEITEGIGLTGMRERLSEFGGSVDLRSVHDGFELLATIPYGMGDIGEQDTSPDR